MQGLKFALTIPYETGIFSYILNSHRMYWMVYYKIEGMGWIILMFNFS